MSRHDSHINCMENRVNRAQIIGEIERFHGEVVDGWTYFCCYTFEAEWSQRSTTGSSSTTATASTAPATTNRPSSRLTNVLGRYT